MTLVVVSGWLVTVANTGDSSAVLDTGDHISEITLSHRIQVRYSWISHGLVMGQSSVSHHALQPQGAVADGSND